MPQNTVIRPRVRLILIVDDNEGHTRACSSILQRAGYKVISAHDGAAGLRALATNPGIDLELLDVFMPEKDGFDFLMGVRGRSVPVVAMSGGGLVTAPGEALTRSRLPGAKAILEKPFSEAELLRVISNALAPAAR